MYAPSLAFAGVWPQQQRKLSPSPNAPPISQAASSDVFQKQPRFEGKKYPASDIYKVEDTSNPELMKRFREELVPLKGDYEEIPIEDKNGNQTVASLFVFGKTKDALKRKERENPASGRGDFAEELEQAWGKLEHRVQHNQTYY